MIRAETERYDFVRFSKVTTKSLASVIGSSESNELGESKTAGELSPGPRRCFFLARLCACLVARIVLIDIINLFARRLKKLQWCDLLWCTIFVICGNF